MAQTWLVGGAVRDELLGLPVHERDWVVVGSDPDAMRAAGYRQVGRDFPVFLHPRTGEEYALARTERKAGHGYHGFAVHAGPEVTLAEDLRRRDLTINAIARAEDGTLYDPCGGRADLQARILRHVSPAFSEDPLRVLRVARFAARLAPLGFAVAAETRALMASMVAAGELAWLVPERVWRETERALGEPAPERYFDELADCGALAVVLPELARYWRAPDALARDALLAATVDSDPGVRLAAATHELDVDAELTLWWERLPVPRQMARLQRLGAVGWPAFRDFHGDDGDAAWALLEHADALRRPDDFARLLRVWSAVGRAHGIDADSRCHALEVAQAAAAEVSGRDLAAAGWRGPELGRELVERRRASIRQRLAEAGTGSTQGSQ